MYSPPLVLVVLKYIFSECLLNLVFLFFGFPLWNCAPNARTGLAHWPRRGGSVGRRSGWTSGGCDAPRWLECFRAQYCNGEHNNMYHTLCARRALVGWSLGQPLQGLADHVGPRPRHDGGKHRAHCPSARFTTGSTGAFGEIGNIPARHDSKTIPIECSGCQNTLRTHRSTRTT